MNDRTAYLQGQIALDDARFMMRADRLTYAVVQTRLREAALEEAEDQVAHLEERWDALAPLDSANARRVAALTAEVDQLRALALAGELDQVLATLIPAMETIGARVRDLADDLARAATLAERAQEYANMLPRETIRQRVAANEIAERVRGMQELTRLLSHFMGEERADHRRDRDSEAGSAIHEAIGM
jgi:predicted  nucleic acid-binding Zn-ribbon protein